MGLKKKYEDDVVVRGVLYSVMVLYHFNGEWLTYRGNRTEISRTTQKFHETVFNS